MFVVAAVLRSRVIVCAAGVVVTTETVNVPVALAIAVTGSGVTLLSPAVPPLTAIVVDVDEPTVYVTEVLGVKPATLNTTVDWLGSTMYALIAVNEGAAVEPAALATVVEVVATVATAVANVDAGTVVTVKVLTPRPPRVPCGVAVRVDVADAAVVD
jgi:hypothetical protein